MFLRFARLREGTNINVRAGLAVLLLTLVVGCGATGVDAGTAGAEHELQQQRDRFHKAKEALKRGDRRRFRALEADLGDYVLHPYLKYWELRRYLSYAKPAQIDTFLAEYADTPLAYRLRSAWLRLLARRKQWPEYLEAYRPTRDVSSRCRHLLALVNTGQADQALPNVQELWLVSRSQPRACDPLFKAWMDAGYLRKELVWKRIALAMGAGQSSLARYLARFLDSDDQHWATLWRRVHGSPKLVLKRSLFPKDHPAREEILAHGLKRMARRDVHEALRAWEQIRDSYPFADNQRLEVQRKIALELASSGESGALELLEALPQEVEDDRIRTWKVVSALRDGQWQRAHQWIENLSERAKNSERWRYWLGRALEAQGQRRPAENIYAELAEARSYYGFLAADRLNLRYQISHQPLPAEEARLTQIMRIGGIRRARELLELGYVTDARREWYAATRHMDQEQLLNAAGLAHEWQWYDQTIFTVAQAKYWDDLTVRFPLAFELEIEREALPRKLDSAWILAMLRQESAFATDARSAAGALGLMQLMPRTAHMVARRLQTRIRNDSDILTVGLNIRLGTEYLRTVLDQLENNPVLATAAYNAGPHRVKQWIPEDRLLPADLWVETVPFRETQNYLRRIFAYTVIYEHRLGLTPTRLRDRMHPVGNPKRLITRIKASTTYEEPS